MVNYIIKTNKLSPATIKKLGLYWLASGENDDYLTEDIIIVSETELNQFVKAAEHLHQLAIRAIQKIVREDLWKEVGIPKNARKLVKFSAERELGDQLIGRYDFAGGLDGLPIKLLEFNADTCTLLPETAYFQDEQYIQEKKALFDKPFNQLIDGLVTQFKAILIKHPDKPKSLLISTMGYQEDWLNTDVIAIAAKKAGFELVQSMVLEKVIFSADEGIFVELNEDYFEQYHFWYKMVPWEFIADDEPELMDLLEKIILNGHAVVVNPAYTMLLQSKAIMKIMYEMEPYNPLLLQTTYDASEITSGKYVKKPIFGRLGENIQYIDGSGTAPYTTDGDYGDYKMIAQEMATFNIDRHDYRYQPSIFWTGKSSALCFRRQDDPIIDDDAEFVGHTVQR